jgi:hypothetical protein
VLLTSLELIKKQPTFAQRFFPGRASGAYSNIKNDGFYQFRNFLPKIGRKASRAYFNIKNNGFASVLHILSSKKAKARQAYFK